MKVTKIEIQEFRQFKKLELDLTYPKGHEKEGERLDKVCIIGQSGTGKTTILETIESLNKNNASVKSEKKLESNPTNQKFNIFYDGIETIVSFLKYKKYNEDWQSIRSEMRKHKEEELKIRVDLSKKIELDTDVKLIEKELNKLKEWQENRPNPIQDLALKFNPLLKQLNIKVKTDFDFETLEKLKDLELETLDNKPIPQTLWSSGTEQLIKKLIPLYVNKPKNTIILLDEPENSLYPDIQTQIVDFYSSLTTNCQFFYATHSPIIASCFEPWEIVELKFNEEGDVYRELYYEGENHVDNYFVDPRYLSVNSILLNIFDLKGNINQFRHKQLIELSKIDDKLQHLKQNGKSPENIKEIKDLIEKYNALAKKLDWEIEYAKD